MDVYVELARRTIELYVRERKTFRGWREVRPGEAVSGENSGSGLMRLPSEMVRRRAGAFVSIHENGALRGCIGTIAATRGSLAEEIVSNAIAASTRDPRFYPIEADELDKLEISVDVLGEAEPVDSPEELDVKRYGVIVSKGSRRGLLLPDLEGVDTVEQQIDIARRKAGIYPEEDGVKLFRFEVVRHE